MTSFELKNVRFRHGVAAVALACFTFAALPALAQTSSDMFKLEISEKKGAITGTSNPASLMRDLKSDRAVARGTPYVELTNLSEDHSMTEFHMTIGDFRFRFDCELRQTCAFVSEAPAGLSVDSSIVPTPMDLQLNPDLKDGDVLVLKFDDGLGPGESVGFNITLGVDEGYDWTNMPNHTGLPDFRRVLFDISGVEYYGGVPSSVAAATAGDENADNSVLMGMFANGGTPMMVHSYLPDHPEMFDQRVGMTEPVEKFNAFGQGVLIPEPGALILATVGLLGMLILPRRCRRCVTSTL